MPSEQPWSSIPPMRPVDPGPAPSAWRPVGTSVLVVGILLATVGIVAGLAPLATFDQICRFAPCDPLVPIPGFRAAADGGVIVETGPTTAAQLTGVTVYGRLPPGSAYDDVPPVVWQIERDGTATPGWDGSVELGHVPPGFAETVAAPSGWELEAASVGLENGCYEGWDVLARGPLRTDRVLLDGGTQEETLAAFRAADHGFTPCDADARLLARRPDVRGFAFSTVGAGLVVLGAVLRRRP